MVEPCPTCGQIDIEVPKVSITPKRPRPTPPGVIEVDDRTWRRMVLAGDVGPGVYRVVDFADRWRTITIPARIPAWVRSPQGWLWHRIRHAEIWWRDPFASGETRLLVTTWCGPHLSSGGRTRPRPLELLDAPPANSPRCSWCDTQAPDRRRLPDRLETLGVPA